MNKHQHRWSFTAPSANKQYREIRVISKSNLFLRQNAIFYISKGTNFLTASRHQESRRLNGKWNIHNVILHLLCRLVRLIFRSMILEACLVLLRSPISSLQVPHMLGLEVGDHNHRHSVNDLQLEVMCWKMCNILIRRTSASDRYCWKTPFLTRIKNL